MRETAPAASGIAIMIAAMVVLPFADALSKLLVIGYAPEQVTWARNLFHSLFLVPVLWTKRGSLNLSQAWSVAHLMRGLVFVAMTASYVTALIWMPLADALAIVFLFPMVVTLLSGLFLGETVRVWHWLAVGVGFLGALLVVQPGGAAPSLGWPFALAAAIFTAIYVIMTRKLSDASSPWMLLAVPAFVGALVLSPVVPWRWTPPDAVDWGIMAAVGALAALTHLLIILAYSRAPVSVVAPFGYVQIVVATILGSVMFDEVPGTSTLAGLVIILGSGVLILTGERRQR